VRSSRRRGPRVATNAIVLIGALSLSGCAAFPLLGAGGLGKSAQSPDPEPSAAVESATPTPSAPPESASASASPAPASQPSTTAGATDCLASKLVNLTFTRPDSGDLPIDGVWVPFQVRVRNECGKDVKAFEFSAEFRDAFGDLILTCGGKVSIAVPGGASRNTAKDTGCTVYPDDPSYQSWTTVRRADLSTSVDISRIVFADGTVESASGV